MDTERTTRTCRKEQSTLKIALEGVVILVLGRQKCDEFVDGARLGIFDVFVVNRLRPTNNSFSDVGVRNSNLAKPITCKLAGERTIMKLESKN